MDPSDDVAHAAYTIISMQNEKKEKRLNTCASIAPVSLHYNNQQYMRRDKRRIGSILSTGRLPLIDWKKCKKDFESELRRLVHRPIQALFIDVSQQESFNLEAIDLDKTMETKNGGMRRSW